MPKFDKALGAGEAAEPSTGPSGSAFHAPSIQRPQRHVDACNVTLDRHAPDVGRNRARGVAQLHIGLSFVQKRTSIPVKNKSR
jgi:hypothetical protein